MPALPSGHLKISDTKHYNMQASQLLCIVSDRLSVNCYWVEKQYSLGSDIKMGNKIVAKQRKMGTQNVFWSIFVLQLELFTSIYWPPCPGLPWL